MNDEFYEPPFEVYGDMDILKNMVINIKIHSNSEKHPGFPVFKIQSLLYKGNKYPVIPDEKGIEVVHYTIYYSYGEQVGKFDFDAALPRGMRKGRDTHTLYVHRKDGGVYFEYYSRKADIDKKDALSSSHVTMSQNEFFKKYKILTAAEREKYKERLFGFFDCREQDYRVYMDYLKGLPLEVKKRMKIPEKYLREMDLPDDELKELLEDPARMND
ncbi:hypothetical protein [Intestinirhabdus alba]|uniref:Uncharacterized protein n=1 Tax=Intestinirhabdus alba TaxID=2899544 RepID=A0A6L6IR70_9ENTR|nr:hypothetical protein [Intestinirhabdus alba]MTH48745.1 hypothetical protein [Intestinirhabdus alba]